VFGLQTRSSTGGIIVKETSRDASVVSSWAMQIARIVYDESK
jgi:hypothetical protein